MANANTLTEPGGTQPDGAPSAADPGAGTLGSVATAGVHAHKPAPHLTPASK